MTSKKTYKPKGYVPNAKDGDGDGMVQDGTEFERPVGTELDWAAPEDYFAEELVALDAEIPTTHVLAEGENILTVAQMYLPKGKTRNEYAKELFLRNGNISVGSVIRLG
jgi:hypothetical protein